MTQNQKEILKSAELLGGYDLIFIDGGHDYSTVKSDFKNYSKYLNKNGVMIVLHDIKSNIVKVNTEILERIKKNSKKYKIKEIFKKGSKMECGLGIFIKND